MTSPQTSVTDPTPRVGSSVKPQPGLPPQGYARAGTPPQDPARSRPCLAEGVPFPSGFASSPRGEGGQRSTPRSEGGNKRVLLTFPWGVRQ